MELDFEILADLSARVSRRGMSDYLGELLEIPCVVFTRVVAWEVSGCDIRDGLGVDAYDLCWISLGIWRMFLM